MSYEYLMQAAMLIILMLASFPAIMLWSKWRNKKRR
jgi:glucan phosphoethanolaminetransferase (alkaline phosphatase superfamily)